jgi:hypothetical protein
MGPGHRHKGALLLEHEKAPLSRLGLRAVLLGAALVVALAFLIPRFHMALNKYDWAFRPMPTGAMFLLFLLIWPVNSSLKRFRPGWAFRGMELLLAYAMMAICGALASEGLYGYVTVNSVFPQYYATPENRWHELFLSSVPVWLQVTNPSAARWFFEGKPPEAPTPWADWTAPIMAWALFAFLLYLSFFCLACLLRKDWIEGQRLSFPFAVLPTEMASDPTPSLGSSFFRNPLLWAGFALPVVQSLSQMANAFSPAVPYAPFYWQVGRWFGATGPLSALQNTYAYVGFETIGILALLPAELTFSLWFFFLLNRLQVFAFAALGYGQEGLGARVFSPSAFITYQEAGGALMLALILLWQSRRSIAAAFCGLSGRREPSDPLDPVSPGSAAMGLVLGVAGMALWARRTGMDLGVFVGLMAIFFAYSLVCARLVAAGGIYVPELSMAPRGILVGLTGTAGYPAVSLSLVTYLQHTFMLQSKVNFLHFTVNDLKILHSARVPGRVAVAGLLLAVVLMLAIAPWVIIHTAYQYGAVQFDSWQFRDSGAGQFGELADSLHSPAAATPYLTLGLLCGGAVMTALNWLHTSFIWWPLNPIGFIIGGTWAVNTRIWTNALIAWILVYFLRRYGGLKLYRKCRPVFLGMVLGNMVIMGLRSVVDPMLGLRMHLSAWG